MEILKIILAANLFSFYFITQNNFHIKWKLNIRPFNCTLCLSAWVGLALFLLPTYATNLVLCMFGAGALSPFIRNFLTNLYQK
jgi:hypothetical protein